MSIHIKPQKFWKRYSLEVFFFIFILVIGITIGLLADQAFGAENPVKMQGQKYEQYIIARPATTTTTTTQPKKIVHIQKPTYTNPPISTPASLPPGSHADWLRQAGVPEDQWPYAELLIQRESGWNPAARNGGGCIGLGQNCPDRNGNHWLSIACPNWQNDPVCQLRRFDEYAQRWSGWNGHQGAWAGSWAHSEATNPHWY